MRNVFFAIVLLFAMPAWAEEPQTLFWEELLPEGELDILDQLYASQQQATSLFGHSPDNPMSEGPGVQIGTFNVRQELDGKPR